MEPRGIVGDKHIPRDPQGATRGAARCTLWRGLELGHVEVPKVRMRGVWPVELGDRRRGSECGDRREQV